MKENKIVKIKGEDFLAAFNVNLGCFFIRVSSIESIEDSGYSTFWGDDEPLGKDHLSVLINGCKARGTAQSIFDLLNGE